MLAKKTKENLFGSFESISHDFYSDFSSVLLILDLVTSHIAESCCPDTIFSPLTQYRYISHYLYQANISMPQKIYIFITYFEMWSVRKGFIK